MFSTGDRIRPIKNFRRFRKSIIYTVTETYEDGSVLLDDKHEVSNKTKLLFDIYTYKNPPMKVATTGSKNYMSFLTVGYSG